MDISVVSRLPARSTNACLVVGVFEASKLSQSAVAVDKDSSGYIRKIIKQGDMDGSIGKTLLLQSVPGISTERVLLVGAGPVGKLNDSGYQKLTLAAVNTVRGTGTVSVISTLTELDVDGRDVNWKFHQAALAVHNSGYEFTQHKSDPKQSAAALKKWQMLCDDKKQLKFATLGARRGAGIGVGCDFARDLGNLAPNVCTPTYLATQAKALAKKNNKLKASILDEAQMKKLGMGALLSVSQGSRQPAKLICIEYGGAAKSKKPVVMVGKGVTFDTGGISIKSSASMDEMKYDMCGAATVLGAMRACVELDLKCNLVCVVAAAENMPDGDASRPGDVVTTMSGQTVEILNTDAEGRLVLCDALTWVEKFKPSAVIDVATLTGACIIALGHQTSAVMSNDQQLADALLTASTKASDKAWQLPLWDEYQSQLDSNFADMANIGGRTAGSITAGCFLSRFAKAYPWAHLDIAGTAWLSGENKGATGRPVPLLIQYLLDNHL